MTRMWIVGSATVLAISGSAPVALAQPPEFPPQIVHRDTFGAELLTSVGDSCQRLDIELFAVDESTNPKGPVEFDFERLSMFLTVVDYESGTLIVTDTNRDIVFNGNLQSASVSVEFELPVLRFQCDPDPTCSMLANCQIVGIFEPALFDLTWTGIGEATVFHTNETTVDSPFFILRHTHTQETIRDATVSGLISVGEFDFEIEDEFGELFHFTSQFTEIE
jgi:hypothetical protein